MGAARRAALALLAVVVCAAGASAQESYDVRILRDVWGVPHVFGARDVDVAYGLAWAHAEDDFLTIQLSMLASRGVLAAERGRDAAANDFVVAWLRLAETVEEGWEEVTPEGRALAEAYAAGMNRYAERHPGLVLSGVLPFRGQDLVAGFAHKNALFVLGDTLRRLLDEGKPLGATAPEAPAEAHGSNSFAVGPRRSSDGRTHLAVNSHQPWHGPVAWWEAHVRSEEGWDAVGGFFPGSPVVLHGHNRNLGWAHTVNNPDLVDVYALESDPADPYRYLVDGEWRRLEVREVPIRVKLFGPLHWTVKRETLWSIYGPAVRRRDGVYAVRYAGMGEVGQLDQIYRMNRARDLDEFLAAMRRQEIAMFNTVYADREGNVYYVYNAQLPRRAAGFDWSGVVPGNTWRTLWTEYLPYDRLPQVLNPRSGFVQNCNSSPFRTTLGPGNPRPEQYDASLGIETRMTSRAHRALEILGADRSITPAEFEAAKFDTSYSRDSDAAEFLRDLVEAAPPEDPELREAQAALASWDLGTEPWNRGAALGVLTLYPLVLARETGGDPPDPWRSLSDAARLLRRHHGRLDPPWQDVNRLRRGRLDLGIGGGPDVLRAIYGQPDGQGHLVGVAGDSYVLLASFGPGGVRSRSIHQFGSATRDERSPHYADQAVLFARGMLKPVWMDEAEIRAHLEREYRPD